jgi:hypothetical protein
VLALSRCIVSMYGHSDHNLRARQLRCQSGRTDQALTAPTIVQSRTRMDSSDTDAYTAIFAHPQRAHRRPQQPQAGLPVQAARKRSASSSKVTTTSAPSAVLPEYTPAAITSPSASDAPPTYTDVDAGDEDEEEGDDQALPLPVTSPLSGWRSLTSSTTTASSSRGPRRRAISLQGGRRRLTKGGGSTDDGYLDGLLARSVHALELSNALLQSTMSTKNSLAAVLHSEDVLDRSLARQQRTLREGEQMQAAWMGEMRGVVEGVEDLFDGREHAVQVQLAAL